MKEIHLTQGKVALVDDYIYEIIGHLKWCWRTGMKKISTGYAGKSFSAGHGLSGVMLLHHIVIGYPLQEWDVIDHIDGNGLNNQRSNLRIVTRSQNMENLKIHRNGRLFGCYLHKSKYKDKIYTRWRSQINIDGKVVHIGMFDTEQEAHEAYIKEKLQRGIK